MMLLLNVEFLNTYFVVFYTLSHFLSYSACLNCYVAAQHNGLSQSFRHERSINCV